MTNKLAHDGQVLKKWLKIKRLSQKEFAEKINKSRQSVQNYIQQKRFSRGTLLIVLEGLELDEATFTNPEYYMRIEEHMLEGAIIKNLQNIQSITDDHLKQEEKLWFEIVQHRSQVELLTSQVKNLQQQIYDLNRLIAKKEIELQTKRYE